MEPVHIKLGDICEGNVDLTIIPCSGKMKQQEIPRIQERIEKFGLLSPRDLRDTFGYGRISALMKPTKNLGTSNHFAFAASVLNSSDRDGIASIGRQIGKITADNPDIKIVEAPFLGCGSGGLSPRVAIPALAEGFLATRHPGAILELKSDNAEAVNSARQGLGQQKPLVVIVHGIRDIARWRTEIAETFVGAGFPVAHTNYGRMNLLEFLLPLPFFRERAIARVWNQIKDAMKLHPGRRVSIIAHSFGTYIVSKIVERNPDFPGGRFIFCGSVVSTDFRFLDYEGRFEYPILNEVGTADPWPAVAESITTGYGSTGTYGFNVAGVKDRFHNGARHGFFLSPRFCADHWVPFFEGDNAGPGDVPAKKPPTWVQSISRVKIKYLISLVIFISILWIVIEPGAGVFCGRVGGQAKISNVQISFQGTQSPDICRFGDTKKDLFGSGTEKRVAQGQALLLDSIPRDNTQSSSHFVRIAVKEANVAAQKCLFILTSSSYRFLLSESKEITFLEDIYSKFTRCER